jgi:outer membrane receptor protein involved in Fe transport
MIHNNSKSSLNFNLSNKFVGRQYLDNSNNDIASLDPYNYTDFILSYTSSLKFLNKIEISLKIGNLFNSLYSTNGYASNFISEGYNPMQDDPFSTAISSKGEYYYISLFPQAPRNFMLRMKIDIQ